MLVMAGHRTHVIRASNQYGFGSYGWIIVFVNAPRERRARCEEKLCSVVDDSDRRVGAGCPCAIDGTAA